MQSPGAASPEGAGLKALSAESLRSVSPGSDSVFYNEGQSCADHVCHHCGREVAEGGPEHDAEAPGHHHHRGQQPDIVQPPADFADSPNGHGGHGAGACGGEGAASAAGSRSSRGGRGVPGRLYKKADQRFRSEERSLDRRPHRFHGEGTRARSEERIQGERRSRSVSGWNASPWLA